METIINTIFLFAGLLGFIFLLKHNKTSKLDTRTWIFSISALVLIPLGATWGVTSFYENEPQAGWVGILAFCGLGLVFLQLSRKGLFPSANKTEKTEPIQKLGYKIAIICLLLVGFLILPLGVLIKKSVETVSDKEQLTELLNNNMISDQALPMFIKKSIAYLTLYGEYPDKLETRFMSYMFSAVKAEEMIKIFDYIVPETERLLLLSRGADAISNWVESDTSYPDFELYPKGYLVKADAHVEDIAHWIYNNFALPEMNEKVIAKFENGEFSDNIQDYLGTPPDHLKASLVEPLAAIIKTQLDSVDVPKKVILAEEMAKTIPAKDMLANKEQIKTMPRLLTKLWLIPLVLIIVACILVFIAKLNVLKFGAWSMFALGLTLVPYVMIVGNPQLFVDGIIPHLAEQIPAAALGAFSRIMPSIIQSSSELFKLSITPLIGVGLVGLIFAYRQNIKQLLAK